PFWSIFPAPCEANCIRPGTARVTRVPAAPNRPGCRIWIGGTPRWRRWRPFLRQNSWLALGWLGLGRPGRHPVLHPRSALHPQFQRGLAKGPPVCFRGPTESPTPAHHLADPELGRNFLGGLEKYIVDFQV